MFDPESGPMDLDGDEPLTPDERQHLRRLIRDDDRMTWARRKMRVFVPGAVAVVIGLWQCLLWIRDHVRVSP